MSQFPDEDEEMELRYPDEFELLAELEEPEEYDIHQYKKSRRSLDFTANITQSAINSNTIKNTSQSDDFTPLSSNFGGNKSINTSLQSSNTRENSSTSTNTSQIEIELPTTVSKKRSINDLFGDIDDILFEERHPKKQKSDKKSEDLALIEHILQLRRLASERNNPIRSYRGNVEEGRERDKRNITTRVPRYPFIGITSHEKERIYIRCHSELYEKEDRERVLQECSFKEVMGDKFKDIWKEAQELLTESMDRESLKSTDPVPPDSEVKDDGHLWVDLYKPRRYSELLSDESTNRTLLTWLKLWDKVVFNRRPKVRETKQEEPKNKFQKREFVLRLGEDGRPEFKVALLSGPPGLGKTTLAHMIARHAGYNVVEINASDDRSTESFKTSLENATQMRSVVDLERRPNCIVFDEIDGAPQSSIEFLVKFINGATSGKSKKNKTSKSVLKRPIICICNELYTPALRSLRQISFVVRFPPTSGTRLAERLIEISRKERIKTDLGAMLALAEKSNNDIRSCLSVLHYLKHEKKSVTLSDILKISVGQKDMQKGLFAVWEEIFCLRKVKTTGSDGGRVAVGAPAYPSPKARMERVLQTVASFGDYERLAQGVFENYQNSKVIDSTFRGTCEALDWFCFSDCLNRRIHALQDYSLWTYLQYAFVVWHFVFGTTNWLKLQYPSAGYEARLKQNKTKAILSETLRGMRPSVRVTCRTITLLIDVLPFLSTIIVPSFRPVSLHLYKEEEKTSLRKVVNIMIDYNLTYIQERTADGTYVYNLDPDIDSVITFSGVSASKAISYSNKQLISREIELEKMRRVVHRDGGVVKENPGESPSSTTVKAKHPSPAADPSLPNHLQRLKAKTIKSFNPVEKKDFFGRVITSTRTTEVSQVKQGATLKGDIWYQYKEGYSNAVRKKIKISALK